MIRVTVFEADGSVRCGGEELIGHQPADAAAVWIDLEGPDPRFEKWLRDWGYHPLAIEDTFTQEHHPKVEEYGDTLFTIVRGIDFNVSEEPVDGELRTLKLASFLSKNRLITLHRAPMRSLREVYRRIEETNRSLPGGVAQVLWTIFDEMMDLYFPVVDAISEKIEVLEEEIIEDASKDQLEEVLALRRKLSILRRTMLPHRQVFSHLAGARFEAIDETAALNFRDTQDNVLRLADAIEQQRDMLTNLKDTYLSVVSQKTNDIMRVLTVFSAVILPLTFIAGVYGMNFENMPELHTKIGYFVVLGVMVTVAAGMLAWFRRKNWI